MRDINKVDTVIKAWREQQKRVSPIYMVAGIAVAMVTIIMFASAYAK